MWNGFGGFGVGVEVREVEGMGGLEDPGVDDIFSVEHGVVARSDEEIESNEWTS